MSDPPCLIEHELYVENAVWILHTLSIWECSSSERLRPCGRGGGGGGTLIFLYIRRLGPFFGLKIFNFNIFGGFSEIFGGYEEYFWGACHS